MSPGVTGETEMAGAMPDEYKKAISGHSALKRLGRPEEIASAALWLASEVANYVTGQSIVVDGGFNIAA